MDAGTAGLADLRVEGHITWFILSIHRLGIILRATHHALAAKMTDINLPDRGEVSRLRLGEPN